MKRILFSTLFILSTLPVLAQNNRIFTDIARDLWTDVSAAAPIFIAIFVVLGLISGLIQYFSPSGDWRKYAGIFLVICVFVVAISGIVAAILSLSF